MPFYNDTNPLANDPTIALSSEEIRTAITLGLGALLFVSLAMVGLRCEFHHFEGWLGYLRS